jgi:hypothetical protein
MSTHASAIQRFSPPARFIRTELIIQGKPVVRRGRKARGLASARWLGCRLSNAVDPENISGRDKEPLKMTHRSNAGNRFSKRVALALALVVSALMTVGSPAMASSAFVWVGSDRVAQHSFGDCKNENSGLHNGYDCWTGPGA